MKNRKRVFAAVVGAGIAALLLWLLFRNIDFDLLRKEVEHVNFAWLALAVVCFATANLIRGLRWWPALAQRGAVSPRAAYAATQMAQLANTALPVRGGPIIRGIALARMSRIPISFGIGASFADRAVEGATLALVMLGLAAGMYFRGWVPPSEGLSPALSTLLMLAAGIKATLILLTFAVHGGGAFARRISRRLTQRTHAAWGEFAAGVRAIITSRRAPIVWGSCVISWTVFILGHAAVLECFGETWNWPAAALTCVFSVVTVIIPGAPGQLGPYHAAVVAALAVAEPDTTPEARLAVAIILHATQFGTLAVMGGLAFLTEHQSLWALEKEEEALEAGPDGGG